MRLLAAIVLALLDCPAACLPGITDRFNADMSTCCTQFIPTHTLLYIICPHVTRRAMIRTMTEAAAVPMFYFCDEVQLDALAAARAAARADPAAAGLKLTFLPFVIKALSLALARCAGLRACW